MNAFPQTIHFIGSNFPRRAEISLRDLEVEGTIPAEIDGAFFRAVATLQRHGRIEVVRDPANRRRKWLTLTGEGRRLYEIMRPQSEKVADYLFSDLSKGETEQLGEILTHLIDTLEARDAAGNSLFLERTKPDSGPE